MRSNRVAQMSLESGRKRERRFPNLVACGMAGAMLASALHAVCFPTEAGLAGIDMKFLLVVPGNLLLAVVLVGLTAWLARDGRARHPEALAFWLGIAVGLGGLAGAWLLSLSDSIWLGRVAIPLSTLLLLVTLLLVRLGVPSRRTVTAINGIGLAITSLLLLGVGASKPVLASESARLRTIPWSEAVPAEGAPDVVLISVDTLRSDVFGRDDVPLPNLNALREHSLWSLSGLSPAASGLPGHFAMFTGQSPLAHGTRNAHGHYIPDEDVPHLPEYFQQAGWLTLGLVCSSLKVERERVAHGFDVYENIARRDPRLDLPEKAQRSTWLGTLLPWPLDGQVATWLGQRRLRELDGDLRRMLLGNSPGAVTRDLALAYLQRLRTDRQPFFFYIHFADLHQPYLPDERFRGRLVGGKGLPDAYADADPATPGIADRIMNDLKRGLPEARIAAQHLQRVYHEELMFVDDCLGRILAALESGGRPTIILLTSDHGEQFGEHDVMGHGNSVYEDLLRVPILLAAPNVEPGEMRVEPHLEDVAPTLLASCGLPIPQALEGRDILQWNAPQRSYAATSPSEAAFYHEGWKLILDHRGLGGPQLELLPRALYNLTQDSEESHNRMETEPDRVASMTKLARAWLSRQSGLRSRSDQL